MSDVLSFEMRAIQNLANQIEKICKEKAMEIRKIQNTRSNVGMTPYFLLAREMKRSVIIVPPPSGELR